MPQDYQFFRELFDEAPLPYQLLDHEGKILNVNRAWQEELGYERHEVLGRPFYDFIASEERPLFAERFSELMERGEVWGVVWALVRKDGRSLRVSFNSKVARDANGRFRRTQCIFFDLSKRTGVEEELRKSEELRISFMDAATEGFLLFDPDLTLIYINEGGAQMFERPPGELLGRTFQEIAPNAANSERYERYKNVLRTGESYLLDKYEPTSQREGNWYTIHAFKVGDNLGIILRDVSAAKRAETELMASEERWRSLADGSPDLIILLDRAMHVEYTNGPIEQIADEGRGLHIDDLVPDERREEARGVVEDVLERGETRDYMTEHVAPDGSVTSYEVRVVPRRVDGRIEGILVSARDISDRKQAELRIARLLEAQTAMAELAIEFGNAQSIDDVYRMAHQQVCRLMDADIFAISRFDAFEQRIHAAYVVSEGKVQEVSELPAIDLEPKGMGTQSRVIRTGEPLVIPDLHEAMDNTQTRYRIGEEGTAIRRVMRAEELEELPKSALLVPLKVHGQTIGVMQVQSYRRNRYRRETDLQVLSGIANIAAGALENRTLIHESQKMYEGVIRALAKAIDLRDPYTSLHQDGVARIAAEICRELNLPVEQVRAIELAANIHDIGKIMIPAEILSKPSGLTGAQRMIVESHVIAAHEVLRDITFPWPIDEIVLQHHERLDGTGYPNGLSGDAIRTEARILAVADVADAMTSHRPYRPAFSREDTAAEIRRMAPDQLDGAVVEACAKLLETRPRLFERHEQ